MSPAPVDAVSTYRDPTFDTVAWREERERRRAARLAEAARVRSLTPDTERHIKRLRILEALKGVLR